MTTLAADKPRAYELGEVQEYPVEASEIIYEGAAVGENASGYAQPLEAGDPFLGFATVIADNSSGSAGDINVKVRKMGYIVLPVTGSSITSNDGPVVYASDDDTFTLTASTNTSIGNVSRWISGTTCLVYFDTGRGPATVDTTDIAAEAVTLAKMADLTRGHLISGQTANNRPTTLDGTTDKQMLISDGTDLAFVDISGDILIANNGAVTIQPTSVETGMIALLAVDTGQLAADAVENSKLADNAVSLENLDAAITPSHIPVYAGETTWTGGGATLAATVSGVAATDIVIASFLTLGTEGTILQGAIASTNTITYTLDAANTSNDAVISYVVYRAAA